MAWSNQVRLEVGALPATTLNVAPAATARPTGPPQGGPWSSSPTHGGFRPIVRPVVVVPPPVAVATPATLASFGRRTVATLIDTLLVVWAVTGVVPIFVTNFESRAWAGMKDYIAAVAGGGQGTFTDDLSHLSMILTFSLIGATLVYGGICLGLWSRTLGQRITGIAVAPVEQPAEKVGWNRGIARTLAWTLLSQSTGLLLILNAFSVTMAVWHPKKQTLPDLLARTQVVRRG